MSCSELRDQSPKAKGKSGGVRLVAERKVRIMHLPGEKNSGKAKELPSANNNNKLFPSRKRCKNVAGKGKSNKMASPVGERENGGGSQSSMKTAACATCIHPRNSKGAVNGIISHIHVTRPQRTVPNVSRHLLDGLPAEEEEVEEKQGLWQEEIWVAGIIRGRASVSVRGLWSVSPLREINFDKNPN